MLGQSGNATRWPSLAAPWAKNSWDKTLAVSHGKTKRASAKPRRLCAAIGALYKSPSHVKRPSPLYRPTNPMGFQTLQISPGEKVHVAQGREMAQNEPLPTTHLASKAQPASMSTSHPKATRITSILHLSTLWCQLLKAMESLTSQYNRSTTS